jgi:hypothetical protein
MLLFSARANSIGIYYVYKFADVYSSEFSETRLTNMAPEASGSGPIWWGRQFKEQGGVVGDTPTRKADRETSPNKDQANAGYRLQCTVD